MAFGHERGDRRACRQALCRSRGRGHAAFHRRQPARGRSRPPGARSLQQLPPSRGRPTGAARQQPVHPGALPRTHARLQGSRHAAGGAADGPCAARARRARHHRGRDLGRHWRRGGRGLSRPQPGRCRGAVSARPHLRGAAPDDDDRHRFQRTRARHRGNLRRLSGAGEGHVQPPCLPRPRTALRRQFHQLGAHHGAGGLLLHRGGGVGRSPPQNRLHRADRKFRRHLRRLRRLPHGIAGRPAGDRHQRQRHSGARAGDRHLRSQDVQPTSSPSMDIQISSNFERLLFEAIRATPGSSARGWVRWRSRGAFAFSSRR